MGVHPKRLFKPQHQSPSQLNGRRQVVQLRYDGVEKFSRAQLPARSPPTGASGSLGLKPARSPPGDMPSGLGPYPARSPPGDMVSGFGFSSEFPIPSVGFFEFLDMEHLLRKARRGMIK